MTSINIHDVVSVTMGRTEELNTISGISYVRHIEIKDADGKTFEIAVFSDNALKVSL